MDLDVFKTIRETVDWLINKYKGAVDAKTKKELGKVADKISELAKNKRVYLASLKGDVSTHEKIDIFKIESALSIAEKDTNELSDLLKRFDFHSEKISFSLKNGLESLTGLKQIEVGKLKELIAKDTFGSSDQEKIIHELAAFEQQWVDLGKEIDLVFKEAKK